MKRGKRKKIILEVIGENKCTMTAKGNMSYGEICDTLLGAYCLAANYVIAKSNVTPEVMRQVAVDVLNDRLHVKEGAPGNE